MIQRYKRYKESTIPGVSEVPAHWSIAALGHRYKVELGKMLDEKRITGKHLAPYLRNTDVQWGRINSANLPMMDFGEDERERFLLRPGDLLVCEGGEIGRSAIWTGAPELGSCFYQKALHRVRPLNVESDSTRFLYYVMRNAVDSGRFLGDAGKATIAHLPAETLRRHRFAFPPISEQNTIAIFLDRETAKIDALIVEQERLIALLVEKRQAVICQAVTKGLNPNVEMRDSGIKWLGEVPEHWCISPLKYVVRLESGGTPSKGNPNYWDGEVPWASSKDLKSEWLMDTVDHITLSAIDDEGITLLPQGTVLTVVRGMILAHTFPVTQAGVPMAINQDLKALHPVEELSNDFLAWGLRGLAKATLARVDEAGHGTKVLRIETWTAMEFPVPPRLEQDDIVAYLRLETAKIDGLVAEAQAAVALLQERRTALISAAVTGKIDMREFVSVEAS